MIRAIISGVMWPPGYYILRDRVPFFLTLIYFHRHRMPRLVRDYLGYYLAFSTVVVASIAGILHLNGGDMTDLAGIHWSPPSPIEWGFFISISYLILLMKDLPSFEAFYYSFIAALGGGWLYEFSPLLVNGFNWFVFFKVNAVKVFFMEFQVFCLPILAVLIYKTKNYENHWSLKFTLSLAILFYGLNSYVIDFVQRNLLYSYRWWVRLPAIFFLLSVICGIKGEKKQ